MSEPYMLLYTAQLFVLHFFSQNYNWITSLCSRENKWIHQIASVKVNFLKKKHETKTITLIACMLDVRRTWDICGTSGRGVVKATEPIPCPRTVRPILWRSRQVLLTKTTFGGRLTTRRPLFTFTFTERLANLCHHGTIIQIGPVHRSGWIWIFKIPLGPSFQHRSSSCKIKTELGCFRLKHVHITERTREDFEEGDIVAHVLIATTHCG